MFDFMNLRRNSSMRCGVALQYLETKDSAFGVMTLGVADSGQQSQILRFFK